VAKNSYISSLIVDSLTLGIYNGYISMTDVLTSTLSSVIINTGSLNVMNISTTNVYASYLYGDGSGLTNVGGGGGGGGISIVPPELSTTFLSTGLLTACNISTYSISTTHGFFSSISANTVYAKFIGDGSDITNVGGWVSTATSDLNMANYNISNVSSIYNQSGGNLSININKDASDVSLFINMNGMSFSITANGTTGDISFTNANSSNLTLNLGGQTGTIGIDTSNNLYWNTSLIWTDANQVPPA
jgi:hypothetical protein